MNGSNLLAGGWKSVSLVDVYGASSFTLWLCGCNLKCPFCHNWQLADAMKGVCREVSVNEVISSLIEAKKLVDYFHITGGEPLMQWKALKELLKSSRDNVGILNSLNTNLTLFKPLELMLSESLLDHIATDLKVPPEKMYGYDPSVSLRLWDHFTHGLELVAKHDISLELRIPIAGFHTTKLLRDYLNRIADELSKLSNVTVVLNPLLNEPFTNPRDKHWCRSHCTATRKQLIEIRDFISAMGFNVKLINADKVPENKS